MTQHCTNDGKWCYRCLTVGVGCTTLDRYRPLQLHVEYQQQSANVASTLKKSNFLNLCILIGNYPSQTSNGVLTLRTDGKMGWTINNCFNVEVSTWNLQQYYKVETMLQKIKYVNIDFKRYFIHVHSMLF